MTTFTHKTHTIELNPNGEFTCRMDGRLIKKKSLGAMKKFLDTPPSFTPFKGLVRRYGSIVEVVVIGVHKTHSKYSGQELQWELEVGGRERRVLADTAANRAALAEITKLETEHEEMRTRLTKEMDAVRGKLAWRTPNDIGNIDK